MTANSILFSAGLALTMATQLRLASLPVGVGESLLFAWLCLSWIEIVGRRDIRIPPDLRPFILFFSVVLAVLLFSSLYQTIVLGELLRNALHDVIAYVFVTILALTFAMLQPSRDYIARSLKIIAIGLTLASAVLLLISTVAPQIGPILLHNGVRFLGLSANPNQLGMALVPIPFLCAFFMCEAKTWFARVGYACCLALALWIGLATVSDALRASWSVGAGLLALLVLMTKVAGRVHPAFPVGNVFAVCILGGLILIATPAGPLVFERLAEGDQGGRRTDQWQNALSDVLKSPFLGRGPGILGRDADAAGSKYGYSMMDEAHNSYLDLAVAAGLPSAGAAIWLTGSLILRPSFVARPLLWSAFMAMQSFIMFHYVFRQPLFWFYLILMTSLAYRDYAIGQRAHPPPALRRPGVSVQPASRRRGVRTEQA